MNDSTAQLLIRAATKLFSEKSYEGTSVRDIAELSGVNLSAINYHFGSKQGLFVAIMKDLANGRMAPSLAILEEPESIEEFRLRYSLFLNSFMNVCCEDESLFRLASTHFKIFEELAPEEFADSFLKIHTKLDGYMELGKVKGFLKANTVTSILVHASLCNLTEAISKKDIFKKINKIDLDIEDERKKYVNHLIDILMDGVGGIK